MGWTAGAGAGAGAAGAGTGAGAAGAGGAGAAGAGSAPLRLYVQACGVVFCSVGGHCRAAVGPCQAYLSVLAGKQQGNTGLVQPGAHFFAGVAVTVFKAAGSHRHTGLYCPVKVGQIAAV